MKKALCVALLFALLAGLAACAKKGEVFVEPPTEIITLENGETMVYELITDESGVTVTDENGEAEYIIYDPPVTESGGYIVTDAQGSTFRQSQTTAGIAVENVINDLDEPTASVTQGTAQQSGSSSTASQTDASGEVISRPQTPATSGGSATTVPVTGIVNQAVPITGTLTKAQAEKLLTILEFENQFDADLCDGDFNAAENSLKTYIADIDLAVLSIKADKTLYQFVGNDNLVMWQDNIKEAQDRYAIFMTMVEKEQDSPSKSSAYISAYTYFQEAYRNSLDAYYCMQLAAQKFA